MPDFAFRKSKWTKPYAGRYEHESGWAVEKSMDHPHWNVINPKTGRVFDIHKTKRGATQMVDSWSHEPDFKDWT